jgi:class 3 adenylate cyclase
MRGCPPSRTSIAGAVGAIFNYAKSRGRGGGALRDRSADRAPPQRAPWIRSPGVRSQADLLGGVRRLLRRAVQRSGGKEVDTRADELFAVFKRPSGALAAALAIQRRAGSRSWPAGANVRLRIGIHTGRPTLTDGGYVGLAVHTAARICSAGHGGQILLSGDAVRAVDAPLTRR